MESDASLEMPTLEIPDQLINTLEDIITEHTLNQHEREKLFQTIKELPATTETKLGRTHLIQHTIELHADA